MPIFSASDYLLLFPEAQVPVPTWSALAPPPSDDPAEALRAPDPVTAKSMARTLAPFRLLSAVNSTNAFFAPWLASGVVRGYVAAASHAALLAAVIVLNSDYGHFFGRRQIIVGTIAAIFPWVGDITWWALAKIRTARDVRITATGNSASAPAPKQDLSGHLLVPLVRWLQGDGSGETASKAQDPEQLPGPQRPSLLEHVEGDPLCPCPASRCLGTTPTWTALLFLVDQSLLSLFPFCAITALGTYTAFVTFGAVFWTLPLGLRLPHAP
ncbi:hypothetical protein DFJ74DRAFT_739100 [Hyaloraphidium curvatum]|nr:hypothetical protein DFJ74DRAFT_739100 [Hyaloraphidium curvatum]